MHRILLADSDSLVLKRLEKLLLDKGHRVSVTDSGLSALESFGKPGVGLLIMDIDLPGLGGLKFLEISRATAPGPPVVLLAGSGSTNQAIEAIKLGAFDYLEKPLKDAEFLRVVDEALQAGRWTGSPVGLDQDSDRDGDALIGRSRAMREVYKAIGRVAPTDSTVLIRGESGTGKELVARAVFQHSVRAGRPFVVVNCVAIPESLLESELFGYEQGAFTGATGRRLGKVEHAQGGTLFLDEIGDMPRGVQAKLLRLIQDKTIERLGGRKPISVDVRIVAATNRNLEEAITAGKFREDLYYRLNVVPLVLPPLRERREDIPYLAEYFLARHARGLAVRSPGITDQATGLLQEHDWPGNVRELANAMEQCLIFGRGRPVQAEDILRLVLGKAVEKGQGRGAPDTALKKWALEELARGGASPLQDMKNHLTTIVLSEALRLTKDNRSKAAVLLGLSRPTLIAKLKKHGLFTNSQ